MMGGLSSASSNQAAGNDAKLANSLRVLFLHILPSIILGILGVALNETGRLLNYLANALHVQPASTTPTQRSFSTPNGLSSSLPSPQPFNASFSLSPLRLEDKARASQQQNGSIDTSVSSSTTVSILENEGTTARKSTKSLQTSQCFDLTAASSTHDDVPSWGSCFPAQTESCAGLSTGSAISLVKSGAAPITLESEQSFFTPPPANHGSRQEVSNFVAKRVDAYEHFILTAKNEGEDQIRLPTPGNPFEFSTPELSSTHASNIAPPSPFQSVSATCLHKALACIEDPNSDPDETLGCQRPPTTQSGPLSTADGASSAGNEFRASIESASCASRKESQGHRDSEVAARNESPHSRVMMAEMLQINVAEAPLGADSLQELIPERLPELHADTSPTAIPAKAGLNDPKLFPLAAEEILELCLDEDPIVTVDSMEEFPAFNLPPEKSSRSLNTESYSSPESAVRNSPIQQSFQQSRHAGSWRASDLDLFSEDPMTYRSNTDRRRKSKNHEEALPNFGRDSIIDTTRLEASLEEEYDSGRLLVEQQRRRQSQCSSASPVGCENAKIVTQTLSEEGDGHWPSHIDAVESSDLQPVKPRKSLDSRETSDDYLFRQASMEVSSVRNSPMSDRPRSGFVLSARSRTRFTPSMLSSRIYLDSMDERPGASAKVGRSVSHVDARFEDWPEYRRDDDGRVGRRHASDMAFGFRGRKREIFSLETFGVGKRTEEFGPGEIPERFGGKGRGWRKKFGMPGACGERGDMKGVVRSILRRRRRAPSFDNTFDSSTTAEGAEQNGELPASRPDVTGRRSGSHYRDFRFECELLPETVFSLLYRLCPENGFRVVVRKPTYKLKIDIPCDTADGPILASILLNRLPHGRGTGISLTRSKGDTSSGHSRDVEAAGVLLRKRLVSHVEFIEDSFTSNSIQEPRSVVR